MSDKPTYMDCWHFIAPLIPVNTDYTKGIECISVLHTAAERAPAEIRMTAQTKLLMICQETGMLGGIGTLPVL